MSPLTKNPYTFHKYPNSANRNIKKAIKAIKILTFYQQRRTPWYHVCEKQQRANSGQGWHFCHAQWTSNGYSYFQSSLTTSAFLYLKLPVFERDNSHAISCTISCQEKGGLHKCIARFITYSSLRRADTWFPSLLHKECIGIRYIITKFSRMYGLPNFLTHGAPLVRFVRQSSAMNHWKKYLTLMGRHLSPPYG